MLENPWSLVRRLPGQVQLLVAGTFVNKAGSFILPFLTLVLSEDFHMSESQTAQLVMAYGAGSLVSILVGGVLTDSGSGGSGWGRARPRVEGGRRIGYNSAPSARRTPDHHCSQETQTQGEHRDQPAHLALRAARREDRRDPVVVVGFTPPATHRSDHSCGLSVADSLTTATPKSN